MKGQGPRQRGPTTTMQKQDTSLNIRVGTDLLKDFDRMRTRIKNASMFQLMPSRSHIIRVLMREWIKTTGTQFPR